MPAGKNTRKTTESKAADEELETIARRKANLELQLFKKKYQRMGKLIGTSTQSANMNPFQRRPKPSVFSEAINDPNMDIR